MPVIVTGPTPANIIVAVNPPSNVIVATTAGVPGPQGSSGNVDPTVLANAVDSALAVHVNSTTPHPAYDTDLVNLTLIFENGLI